MSRRKTPGNGSRLRNSETYRVTGNYDAETLQQAREYAERHGVSLAEALRQLVEFGLETVSTVPISPKQGKAHASADAKG
ncbi:hypothetical protein V1281_002600 [Nitrobacteraceae bacterium AZCC 2161]|jgi:hypothetical protein